MNRAQPRPQHVRRRVLLAGVVAALALGIVAPPAGAESQPQPTRSHPLRVLFMGDSLAYESRDYFDFVLGFGGRAKVDDSLVFGGTAICDWLKPLRSKVRKFRPDVAVAEFAGNAVTPCMRDRSTGEPVTGTALVEKYAKDAKAAMRIFSKHDVSVYWVNPPASCALPVRVLSSVFIRTASDWSNAEYIDADGALNRDGSCTTYLPCIAGEPCTATNPANGQLAAKVRAPDGLHFCPDGAPAVKGVTGACDVWSSGAFRYATAVAVPIIQQYQLTPSTAPLVPPPSAIERFVKRED